MDTRIILKDNATGGAKPVAAKITTVGKRLSISIGAFTIEVDKADIRGAMFDPMDLLEDDRR